MIHDPTEDDTVKKCMGSHRTGKAGAFFRQSRKRQETYFHTRVRPPTVRGAFFVFKVTSRALVWRFAT